jgi:hypothetical protein
MIQRGLWAQLGSNLDPPCRKAPGELFRQGLDCRGGSSTVGNTETQCSNI